MAHLGYNHTYGTGTQLNSPTDRNRQSRTAIRDISGMLGSMALGPDPSDDALFYKRLEDARGSQLSNQGLTSTLNARDLIATNPDFINKIILSLGIDPTTMEKGRMGDFGTYAAQTDNPLNVAGSLSTFGRGAAATAKEREALAQSKLMNPELLKNLQLTGENLGLAGDFTNQQIFNLEDLQINRDAESAAGIAQTEAGTKKMEQETANLLAGFGLEKTESEADVGLVKEKTEQVEKLTPEKVQLLKSQAKVPEASAVAIGAESEETVKLLQQRVVKEQAATWVQRALERATRTNTRNKNAESGQRILQLQAQTGVYAQQANAIVAAIANKDYESALKGMKTATEAMVTSQIGAANVEKIGEQMKVLQQQVLNLQAEQGNKNNESGVRVEGIKAETELTEEQITTETTLRPRKAELIGAKTDYWRARGHSEMADILGLTSGGTPGKKNSLSQFDYRKTKTAFEMNYNIEDVGKKYIVKEAKEGTFRFGWGEDAVLEEATYLWPDDDKAVRAILTPTLQQGKAAQTAAIAEARAKLSEFGKDKPKEIHAIIKSIMQVPPSK